MMLKNRLKAIFFDMDGVLLDSMPLHEKAWSKVFTDQGLDFLGEMAYYNEGRKGRDIIIETFSALSQTPPDDHQIQKIYDEKVKYMNSLPNPEAIKGIDKVLSFCIENYIEPWIITGSAQIKLLNLVNMYYNDIFIESRIITGSDVKNGKPHPDPYLLALKKSNYSKDQVLIVENAPLGIESGKASGIMTWAINTGKLTDGDLCKADCVFSNAYELLECLSNA